LANRGEHNPEQHHYIVLVLDDGCRCLVCERWRQAVKAVRAALEEAERARRARDAVVLGHWDNRDLKVAGLDADKAAAWQRVRLAKGALEKAQVAALDWHRSERARHQQVCRECCHCLVGTGGVCRCRQDYWRGLGLAEVMARREDCREFGTTDQEGT